MAAFKLTPKLRKLVRERRMVEAGWDELCRTLPPDIGPNHRTILRNVYFMGAGDMLAIVQLAVTDKKPWIIEMVAAELDEFSADNRLRMTPEGHA